MTQPFVYPFKVETAVTKYTFVKLGTLAGQIVPCGAGENAIGVAQTDGAAGSHVNVCLLGETYIIAGAAIATNTILKAVASGHADDAAAIEGEYDLGLALEAATAANDQIKMLFGVGVNEVKNVV